MSKIEKQYVPTLQAEQLIADAGHVVVGIQQTPGMTFDQAVARAAEMKAAGWKTVGIFRLCGLIGDIELRR